MCNARRGAPLDDPSAAIDPSETGRRGPKSRGGQSGAHLLNFAAFTPAAPAEEPRRAPPRRPQKSRYNKMQHTQANFHFVMAPGDYRGTDLDPDFPLPWESVRAVRFTSAEALRCPICLCDHFTAPQMHQCGHVMCLPCALQFHAAADADGKQSKCPICAEPASLAELRSVYICAVAPPAADGTAITFRRLRRGADARARLPSVEAAALPRPTTDGFSEAADFEPLLERERSALASEEQGLVDAAVAVLAARAAAEAGPAPPTPAEATAAAAAPPGAAGRRRGRSSRRRQPTCSAAPPPPPPPPLPPPPPPSLGRLRWRLVSRCNDAPPPPPPPAAATAPAAAPAWSKPAVVDEKLLARAREACAEEIAVLARARAELDRRQRAWRAADADAPPPRRRVSSSPTPAAAASESGYNSGGAEGPEEARWVWQAADGQLLFADNLSVRVLVEEYGANGKCPETVAAPLLELHSFTQTDETRKRYKLTSHLPIACSYYLAQLDLSKVVSARALSACADQLDRRAAKRRERRKEEAKERAAERQRSERDRKEYGRSALAMELELMAMTPEEAARRREQLSERIAIDVAPEWAEQWEASAERRGSGPSFASMVHKGFAATGPALSPLAAVVAARLRRQVAAAAAVVLAALAARHAGVVAARRRRVARDDAELVAARAAAVVDVARRRRRRRRRHGTSMLRVKGPGGAVWGVSSPPPRQAFVVPGAAQPDAADGDDAECAPPPLAAAWASAASGAASGAAASGGGGKGKKKKGRDASHLLGFTSERADAVGADED